jgi:hypothetical protein
MGFQKKIVHTHSQKKLLSMYFNKNVIKLGIEELEAKPMLNKETGKFIC